jgi:CubicO group peptidase (beta-lactamase class C family)
MAPDPLQHAWHAHSAQTHVTVDADLLLREVQRNQAHFQAIIFWRDFREVGTSLLLLPVWFGLGYWWSLPWTWYLTVPALLWVAGFMLIDRLRHAAPTHGPNEPLLSTVQASLAQVQHQIWLLRNVFWWYLLPLVIPMLLFFAHISLRSSETWLEALASAGFLFGIGIVSLAFSDHINQYAIRSELAPRRRELLALQATLAEAELPPDSSHSYEPLERSHMLLRWAIVAAVSFAMLLVTLLASRQLHANYEGPAQSDGPAGDALAELVTDLRAEHHLVGLAAMVLVDGKLQAAAAQGERKSGSGVPVQIGDFWHIGSITKSITATMIARLVESKKLDWSDTVGQHFPDATIHEQWKPVTLKQLLTHTSGAPANFSFNVMRKKPALGAESTRERRQAVEKLLAKKPDHPPGKQNVYSNVGYTIAGAIAEQATGKTWEDLVRREVFEPLQLAEAGFGPPQSPDKTLPQPRGHRSGVTGKTAMDDQADNTFIIGPAGIVHMSLHDLATYGTEHLHGEAGDGKLLAAETFQQLHTPVLDHYACGWVKRDPSPDFPHTCYWHNGSNTFWYALVVLIPDKNMVVAVTSNDGDIPQAESAAWTIVTAAVQGLDAP